MPNLVLLLNIRNIRLAFTAGIVSRKINLSDEDIQHIVDRLRMTLLNISQNSEPD